MKHERPNKGATDVWLTPLAVINALGPFDLDPCGEEYWPTAWDIFTENGLDREWHGRVWLNPPYSEVGAWLDKLANHGRGIALVHARTDTKWAQKAMSEAESVFFPLGRFKFFHRGGIPSSGNAGAPSMFLSYGEKPEWPFNGFKGR